MLLIVFQRNEQEGEIENVSLVSVNDNEEISENSYLLTEDDSDCSENESEE